MPASIARSEVTRRPDPWEAGADALALLVLVWPIRERQLDAGGAEGMVFIGLSVLVVLLRRRWPLPAMVAALVLALVGPLVTSVLPVWLAAHVCLLTFALRRPLRQVLVAAVAVFGVVLAGAVGQLGFSAFDLEILGLLAWTSSVTAVGAAVRSQRQYVALIEERALRLQQNRDSEVRRRVTEERLRIARDLHDAVAHSITVISLHAGSAQSTLGRSDESTRASLQHINAAARVVLTEMQEILQVLRTDGPQDGASTPQEPADGPVIGRRGVPDLVESFRAAGLPVGLRDTTGGGSLEPAADAAVYRVVQEALTNARRHGTGPVEVEITASDDATEVRVTNARATTAPRNPRGDDPESPSSGYGLVGMRERVSQARGRLEVLTTEAAFTLLVSFPHAGPVRDVVAAAEERT